jgi:hypothetical protein
MALWLYGFMGGWIASYLPSTTWIVYRIFFYQLDSQMPNLSYFNLGKESNCLENDSIALFIQHSDDVSAGHRTL